MESSTTKKFNILRSSVREMSLCSLCLAIVRILSTSFAKFLSSTCDIIEPFCDWNTFEENRLRSERSELIWLLLGFSIESKLNNMEFIRNKKPLMLVLMPFG